MADDNETIKKKSQMIEFMFGRCDKLLDEGKPDEAVACFRKARGIAPEAGITWYNEGKSLYLSSKFDEAIACCDEAIKRSPEQWMPHALKAKCLFEFDRLDEATSEYEMALKVNPKIVETLVSLAFCWLIQKDLAKARDYAKTALEINSEKTLVLLREIDNVVAGMVFLEGEKVFMRLDDEFREEFEKIIRELEAEKKTLDEKKSSEKGGKK